MIVVDASAILEVLLRTDTGLVIEARFFTNRQSLHAPHLIDLEVVQVLRRYAASREFTMERGAKALAAMANFPIVRYRHDMFLSRIWELRNNLSAYDAAYIALAEALDAPLLTRDRRLARVRRHRAKVEVV